MCGKKNSAVSMGGWALGQVCADPGGGPPSAPAEINEHNQPRKETKKNLKINLKKWLPNLLISLPNAYSVFPQMYQIIG